MTQPTKPREFWVSPDRDAKTSVMYEDSNGMSEIVDCFCASDEPLDSDAIKVIEHSAFQKAVDALRDQSCDCYQTESDHIPCKRCETLKELGEL